jgi:hypothetical protein
MTTMTADQSARQFEAIPTARDRLQREGLGYSYELPEMKVRLRADYIEHARGELSAEIVAESTAPGLSTHLLRTRMNLLVVARQTELSKQLSALVPASSWDTTVRAFCEGVILAEREGEPFVMVGARPARVRPAERVERILIERKPTLLYGEGGAGKGYVAVGIAAAVQAGVPFAELAVRQGEVLYLDWEDDEEELDERVKEVARGLGLEGPIELHYRAMREPLHYSVNRLARYIAEHDIRLVIVDSVELAAGGSSDRGTYEEVAKRFFLALRQLGPVTSLLIDHISEEARQNRKSVNKAYGAIFKANWCRRAFEVKYDAAPGERVNHLGFYMFKTNRGEIQTPFGLAIDFQTPGTVSFHREDVRDNPQLREALPAVSQIEHALDREAMKPERIVEETGLNADHVRVTLNRYKGKRFVKLADGRWGPLSHHLRGQPELLRTPVTQTEEPGR